MCGVFRHTAAYARLAPLQTSCPTPLEGGGRRLFHRVALLLRLVASHLTTVTFHQSLLSLLFQISFGLVCSDSFRSITKLRTSSECPDFFSTAMILCVPL